MQRNNLLMTGIAFCLIVILIQESTALGISPGRTTIDFSPGLTKQITLTLINSDHEENNVHIYTRGELNESVTITQNTLHITPDKEKDIIIANLKLPDTLTPGLHTVEIVAQENVPTQSGAAASVGASMGVASQVYIYVPYPGKYVDALLKVSGDEKEKKFIIETTNRGKEDIKQLTAEIVLYDSSGAEMKRLQTNVLALEKGAKKELTALWTVDQPVGEYNAKAILAYDQDKMLLEKEFTVGQRVLDLQRIFVENFTLGEVAKFNMIVNNKWNEPMIGAYSEMRVFDEKMNEIADVKSSTYDIPAGVQTTMVYYWDTKDLQEGTYNSNIILYYNNQKTQQDVRLEVGKKTLNVVGIGYVISSEKTSNNMTTMLIGIIGFLILLNILWFVVLRNRVTKTKK